MPPARFRAMRTVAAAGHECGDGRLRVHASYRPNCAFVQCSGTVDDTPTGGGISFSDHSNRFEPEAAAMPERVAVVVC